MAPCIRGQELQAVAEALFELGRAGSVVAVTVGNSHGKAGSDGSARGGAGSVDVAAAVRADGAVCCSQVGERIGVAENQLVSLMIAFITELESHIVRQFALQDDVPLVDQRIAEVALNATELNGSIQRERADGVTTGETAGQEVAVGAERI